MSQFKLMNLMFGEGRVRFLAVNYMIIGGCRITYYICSPLNFINTSKIADAFGMFNLFFCDFIPQ